MVLPLMYPRSPPTAGKNFRVLPAGKESADQSRSAHPAAAAGPPCRRRRPDRFHWRLWRTGSSCCCTFEADLTGVNVLLAEDNELNAEIATVQLEEFGMNVERAVDGKNAVEIFRNHPKGTFDVILMDVMMPEMNGYEATKAIRAMNDRPDGKNIPIIAMTANSFAEDVQASLDAGMNAHLSKPIVIDEVIKTILRYVL